MKKGDDLIKKLNLIPHPEGGHFSETYRHNNEVSHIYYLLKKNEFSHWHKLNKNEILNFYDGDPLKVFLSNKKEKTKEIILGNNTKNNEIYHYVVKAGTWFSMQSLGEFSLIGCIIVPAFNYSDFELAPKNWSPLK